MRDGDGDKGWDSAGGMRVGEEDRGRGRELRWERERWIWERIFYRKEGMRMRDGEGARGDEGCARRKSCYWNGNKG